MLIQFTLYSVAIFAMIGLVVDAGRYLFLNNDLQDLADAAALRGARDLDGSPTANNAIADAMAFTSNPVHWVLSTDLQAVKILSAHVYKTWADVKSDTNTDGDPRQASYIKVTTGVWGITPTFLSIVGAKSNTTQVSAVAQSSISTCVPMQMMLCNPYEVTTGEQFGTNNPQPGQMFKLSVTGNTDYGPGDFNLLDAPAGNGAPSIEAYLTQQSVGSCTDYDASGASPAQGQKTNTVSDGINVRFDQAPSGANKGWNLTAAPIVIDGIQTTKSTCNKPATVTPSGYSLSTPSTYASSCTSLSCPLPIDPNLTKAGSSNTYIGSGVSQTDLQTYWQSHHGGTLPTGVTTRYQAYQREVNGSAGFTSASETIESSAPQCLTKTSDPSRRILQVAVVDCVYSGVKGNSTNHIPINTYSDFFLTSSTSPGSADIYTEYVQTHSIAAGNATGLHQVVRLVQ